MRIPFAREAHADVDAHRWGWMGGCGTAAANEILEMKIRGEESKNFCVGKKKEKNEQEGGRKKKEKRKKEKRKKKKEKRKKIEGAPTHFILLFLYLFSLLYTPATLFLLLCILSLSLSLSSFFLSF